MKNYLKKKFKIEKGFTGQDILVAIFVVLLFLSLISALMLNLTKTSLEVTRMKKLTETLSKVMDNADALKFGESEIANDVTDAPIPAGSALLKDVNTSSNIDFTYTVKTTTTAGKKEKKITIKGKEKKLNVEVSMELSKFYQIKEPEASPIKNTTATVECNYNAQWPFNRPTNSEKQYLAKTSGILGRKTYEDVTPIKFVWHSITSTTLKGHWENITNYNDLEWYSIEEGILPTYINKSYTGRLGSGTGTTYNPYSSINKTAYVWIPQMGRDKSNYSSSKTWYYRNGNSTGSIIQHSKSGLISEFDKKFYTENKTTDNFSSMSGARGYIVKFGDNDRFYYNGSSIMDDYNYTTYIPPHFVELLYAQNKRDNNM